MAPVSFQERHIRLFLALALVVVGLGVYAFVLKGADQPADPYLDTGAATSSTTTTAADGGPGATDAAEPGAEGDGTDDSTVGGPPEGGDLPGNPDRVPLEGFGEVAVAVQPEGVDGWLRWCLLAARDAAERGRGLMEVTDLQGYSGMAFLYDDDATGGFYMRNTPTPLSIAWIGAAGEVVTILDMEPCEDRDGCPTYHPTGPYRTAIEVFRGDLEGLGITPGATVAVGGSCAPLGQG